jgi:hypothetical protein
MNARSGKLLRLTASMVPWSAVKTVRIGKVRLAAVPAASKLCAERPQLERLYVTDKPKSPSWRLASSRNRPWAFSNRLLGVAGGVCRNPCETIWPGS